MDRQIVYIGQVPQDTDVLLTNLNAYIALAKLTSATIGSSTLINGLQCSPTSPASMQVTIGAGEIYQLSVIDSSAYGSLAPNSNNIVKQGININSTTLAALTAPSTVGYSINYLIEFVLNESDGGSQILPYYNSENPSQAFAGPNNSGQPNYTIRQDTVGITVKAGTAAPTGTQTTPSPDANYVGGWVVTVAQGQTSITSSSIALYPSAPYVTPTFYAADTSVSANTVTITTSGTVQFYTVGLSFFIKIANTNTGAATLNVNGLGAKSITYANGAAVVAGDLYAGAIAKVTYDGTKFQLANPVTLSNLSAIQTAIQTSSWISANDTGSANAYAAAMSPALTSYTAGNYFLVKILNTNTTTSCTLNINSLGAKTIILPNGGAPAVGDIYAGMEAQFFYNGTNFILMNAVSAPQIQNCTYTNANDGGAANAYTVNLTPSVSSYTTGLTVTTKIANTNTSTSCTLNVNSLGTKNITLPNGAVPEVGDIVSGMEAIFVYDGTNFQIVNPASVIKKVVVQVFTSSGTYTPTAGMLLCSIECVGGGGGGGGTQSTSASQAAVATGGSGGGYARKLVSAATIGSSQTVTIGAGGSGGAAGNAGAAGGQTSVGVIVSASGGGAGKPGNASTNPSFGNAPSDAGGTGSNGDVNVLGEIGGLGSSSPANNAAYGGKGGRSHLGGAPVQALGANGNSAAANTGAGGGGGGGGNSDATGRTGGNGGSGIVIITEYCTK